MFVVACGDPTEQETDTSLTVDTTPLSFTAEGGTETLTVTSTLEWTATSGAPEWLTVTPNADKTEFTATTTANDGGERQTTITVSNGTGTPKVIEVSQAGVPEVDTSLTVDTTPLSFTEEGGTETIAVTSELEWTATSSATEWLTVTQNAEKTNFEVVAAANEGEARSATITVDNGNGEPKVIDVSQEASTLITFIGAKGFYWEPFGDSGDFSLHLWSHPVNEYDMATGEGYKLELSVLSAIPTNIDVVELAAGDYTATSEITSMAVRIGRNKSGMPEAKYVDENNASTDLWIVGGTMKIEGTTAEYTITFNFDLEDADNTPRNLKGKFTGTIEKLPY